MAKVKQLVEDVDSGYEVSEKEILLYAKHIGINIKKEKHLLWIAREGLSAKVPKPWKIFSDEKGNIFYHNPITKESSFEHPLDRKYASLVLEERCKSRNSNSTSTDHGFESKLSSLADAPPLSSSGNNAPSSGRLGKNKPSLSGKKLELGKIENRRGNQLAPVRLGNLKVPVPPSQKPSGGISFMPKGTTLTKNLRRKREEADYNEVDHQESISSHDESNESLISDDGSKYSYEDSGDEEKSGFKAPDLLDASQLSPMPSADESPDALEINSLVQLGANSSKMGSSKRSLHHENSPSLSLRKVGQPTILKPLSEIGAKNKPFKASCELDPVGLSVKGNKKQARVKTVTSRGNKIADDEVDTDYKISANSQDQHVMVEQIQKEWMTMQDEVEKIEELRQQYARKLEEEEAKLRCEFSAKVERIKDSLKIEIEQEEVAASKELQAIKDSNQQKINDEKSKLQKELEALADTLKSDIEKMEEKNAVILSQKQKELDGYYKAEIDKLQLLHGSEKKAVEDAHSAELTNLKALHSQRMSTVQDEINLSLTNFKIAGTDSPETSNLTEERQKLKQLIEDEEEKYQSLLSAKEDVLKEISSQKTVLENLKAEISDSHLQVQDLQDEIDKHENDLELLRNDKSTLISELNVLRDNIKNEKSCLLNLEKKKQVGVSKVNLSKEYTDVGVNTETETANVAHIACQVSVICNDVSCQAYNRSSTSNASTQVAIEKITVSNCCQTDLLASQHKNDVRDTITGAKIGDNVSTENTEKTLEAALNNLGAKLDSRINVIESHLRSLQEHFNLSHHHDHPSQAHASVFSSHTVLPNSDSQYHQPLQAFSHVPSNFLPANDLSSNPPAKCRCEVGDVASCNVLQDVKNSIYHLNSILSHNFVPSVKSPYVYHYNQPLAHYSSPFEAFYAQLREIQEKRRSHELKQNCEKKLTKPAFSQNSGSSEALNNAQNQFLKPFSHHSLLHSPSNNRSDDSLVRARHLLIQEQTKASNERHSVSFPQHFTSNASASLENQQPSIVGLNASFGSLSQHSFVNFEVDPEADHNNWMSRLNALQLRIRSHKML